MRALVEAMPSAVIEAAGPVADQVKTVAGGCGPLACASCPFAKMCRGEDIASALSAEPEADAVVEPLSVAEKLAPVAETPPEPTSAKAKLFETEAVTEPKPETPKAAAVLPDATEHTAPATPAPAAIERQARMVARDVDIVALAPKTEAAPVKTTPVTETRVNTTVTQEAVPQPPTAARAEKAAESGTDRQPDVAAMQAAQEAAVRLTDTPGETVVTEQSGEIVRPTVITETITENRASEPTYAPNTQSLAPTIRQRVSPAPNPNAQAAEAWTPVITHAASAAKTKTTAGENHSTVKPVQESAVSQATAPIVEKLAAKLASVDVAAVDAKISELLVKFTKHETGVHAAAASVQHKHVVAAALKDLGELLGFEPKELEHALQTAASQGETRGTQIVELLTSLQQLTQGVVSKFEIDRLYNQSYLNAVFNPQQTSQPQSVWSLGILVMTSLVHSVLRHHPVGESQDSLAAA